MIPDPPDGLTDVARQRWLTFRDSDVAQLVQQSDIAQLTRWIEAVDERERVRAALVQSRLVRGSTGQPVLNPLAAYLQQLSQEIERAEDAFGMTPTSRARLLGVSSGGGSTDDEFDRLIAGLSSPLDDATD